MLQSRKRLYGGIERTPFVTKRREPGSILELSDQLDDEVRRIIRGRDRWCVTCGTTKQLEVSHFFSRRHQHIRFDLQNCNAQCRTCNRLHNRNRTPYEKFFKLRYGQKVIDQLDVRRRDMRKVTVDELRELLTAYKRM